MASTQGCPYIVIAETEEPIVGLNADELAQRAQMMMSSVIEGLTLAPAQLESKLRDVVREQIRPSGVVRSSVPM
jgi:hypothetical protein